MAKSAYFYDIKAEILPACEMFYCWEVRFPSLSSIIAVAYSVGVAERLAVAHILFEPH